MNQDVHAIIRSIECDMTGEDCMKNIYGALIALVLLAATWVPLRTVQAAEYCFAETGFCIDAAIVPYWQRNGGLSVFGYPIGTPQERTVDGYTIRTQYFERHRIEVHPLAAPYTIQLGRVGAEELQARYGTDNLVGSEGTAAERTRGTQRGCTWFAETGHAVCGTVLTFWKTHGVSLDARAGWSYAENLALWGYPLSPELTETNDGKTVTVQYFERGRLELHPENRTPYDVLAGLLARSALQRAQNSTAPTSATPATAILPDSVLQTFITNKMPVEGYWQASDHGIYSAVTNFRYLHTFSSYNAPDGRRFVAMTVQYRNDRQPDQATEYSGPELYTLIDLNGTEHALDERYKGLTGYMVGTMVAPGQRNGGQLLFVIDKDTAPKQLRVQTNAGPVTIELRVWPIVP